MIQGISFVFWLIAVPFCIGLTPAHFLSEKRRNPGVALLAGYLLMWAVFEVIAVPAIVWIQYDNFAFVLRWFMVASILLAILGIVVFYLDGRAKNDHFEKPLLFYLQPPKPGLDVKIEWGLFIALVGFQLYMAVTRASFDGDDAYYVVESLMAQQSGAMYRNLPYTGRSAVLDTRHALAAFPMWIAFVAVKADLHATIVSHVIMPLVLIPLSYLVYYEIGKTLFSSAKEKTPVFMIVMGMLQMFGNVSIYTNETFFLTRTWQGKSVVGSFVIPMLFLLLLWIFEEEKSERERESGAWIMLVCLHLSAGMCSSISVFLLVLLLAIMAFCFMMTEWDIMVPIKLGLTCIPSAAYVLLYLILIR